MSKDVIWVTPDPDKAKRTDSKAQPTSRTNVQVWREEIFGYYEVMKTFNDMDPSDVFRSLSAYSARASEIRAHIGEKESRTEAAFRIRVIDPFLEECDRQFKIHSRTLATDEMMARLAGGRFT